MAWTGPKILALSSSPPNICKPLLVSPFPPPVVTTSALSIEELEEGAIAKRKIRKEQTDEWTDRHMIRKRFLVDAISNEHCHRSRCNGRKQVSRSKRNRTIYRNTFGRFSGTSLLRGSASVFFFAYTIYSRIKKNRNVSDNSFCNDPYARDVLQSFSRSFIWLSLALTSPRCRLLWLSQFLAL